MKARCLSGLGLTVVATAAFSLLIAPGAARAQYTASAGNVTLKLTIPEGVPKLQGVLAFTVRGLASGWAGNAAFKDMAKRINAGIAMVSGGDDLNDNSYPNRCKSGEFNGIPMALEKLAMMSNHPELANVPLIGLGHSHGGDYWNWFNACHPERMAMVFVHASGGVNYSAASLKVPVFYTLGTGDLNERGSGKPRAGMFVNRGKGAPMTLVIEQGGHDTQFSAGGYQIVTSLIEAIFRLRVPADSDPAKGPVRLNEIDEKAGGYWVGDIYTKEISPYATFKGNKAVTAFLPSEQMAMMWKAATLAMPTSIMLPSGSCGWCGTPKDEPAAVPGGPVAMPPDGGAPSESDAGAPPTQDPDAGASSPPSASVDAATAPPKKKDAGMATPPSDPPVNVPAASPPEGCSMAPGGRARGSALLLAVTAALLLVRRRRR